MTDNLIQSLLDSPTANQESEAHHLTFHDGRGIIVIIAMTSQISKIKYII